jgi:hypothetical protein
MRRVCFIIIKAANSSMKYSICINEKMAKSRISKLGPSKFVYETRQMVNDWWKAVSFYSGNMTFFMAVAVLTCAYGRGSVAVLYVF